MSALSAGLVATNVSVSYGGSRAIDGVSLAAETGAISGLIGPNGAGKTTLFNALSGLISPASGDVTLGGRPLTGLRAHRRALAGLGRTFQRPALVRSLTVRDNVKLGFECRHTSWSSARRYVAGRAGRTSADTAAEAALELCGLTDLAGALTGSLTLGQQRFCELARACAAAYDFLLLDEPASGLDDGESVVFGRILTQVVRERGTGVLLVEHDMALVQRVCSRIYVLDNGQLIFDGTPSQLRASHAVRRAYLGEYATAGPAAGSSEQEASS
jgi:ABC-type branched-subunit amino acid transport system ATPase component